jgi:hypothetical protein
MTASFDMIDKCADTDLDNRVEIINIQFGFAQKETIKLLEKRGKAIQNLDWDKKRAVDKKLREKFTDKKFKTGIQRIHKAFIMFETEEGR